MSAPPITAARAERRKKRSILPWVLGGVFVFLVLGFLAAKLAINAYLGSDRFRQFVAEKTGESLKAEVKAEPFQFSGSTIYSDGLRANGSAQASFSALQLDQVRIDISARRFFERVWQIDQVDVQRALWKLDGPRISLPERPVLEKRAAEEGHPDSGFFPNRVEVGAATIHSTEVDWNGGGILGLVLEATQREGGWIFNGHGGRLQQGNLPVAEVDSVKLRYREPTLFIESAELRQGDGTISASGEVQPEDHADVLAKLSAVSITPLLPEDWRVRLKGNLNGEVRIQASLPLRDGPQLSGKVHMNDGHLEALPVLDEIAIFTGSAQFRHLSLSKASGDFKYDGVKLSVTNFELESARLIRIEGSFVVQNDRIDGDFQVGVTPSSLQWLPGAQERVFTVPRGGYLWAPMRLTGPVSKPSEDLSPRLAAAAKGAVIDAATGLVRDLTDKAAEGAGKPAQDAAKQVQDVADKALHLFLGK